MSNLISLKELRLNLSDYTDRVMVNNESFLVLRRSKPAFKIVPFNKDEKWETIVDFTEIDPLGVPASKVQAALAELIAEDNKYGQDQKVPSKIN